VSRIKLNLHYCDLSQNKYLISKAKPNISKCIFGLFISSGKREKCLARVLKRITKPFLVLVLIAP